MLKKLLLATIFFSFILLSTSKANAQPAVVAPLNPVGTAIEGFSDLVDYCRSRQGNVMNLETWYSGKCPSTIDSLTGGGNEGEYRGFSDIVFLDFITKFLPENPEFWRSTADSGAIPALTKIMATSIIQPPASGVQYLSHINQNLQDARLVQPAYAQDSNSGFGFNKLLPILPAWEGVRNIAYTLFILVFVVYGFMMMFRTKINPQTVINFELAIPKLVVTLLAITFSYAIAGLIIDISLLVPAFIVSVLGNAGVINTSIQFPFSDLIPGEGSGLPGIDPVSVTTGQSFLGGAALGFQVLYDIIFTVGVAKIASLFTGIPTILYSIVFAGPLGIIIKLILVLAFFYILVRVAFMMMQSYVIIVLNIIFAPIILLGNILPGSQAFGNWVRNLLAHISVFPSVIIMFLLAISFLGETSPINSGDMWVPPYFLGSAELETPLGTIGGFNSAQGIGALIAYGIIFLTPKVADMIRDTLKVPPFKYGSAIGEALTAGYTGEKSLSDRAAAAARWAQRQYGGSPVGKVVSVASGVGRASQGLVDTGAKAARGK